MRTRMRRWVCGVWCGLGLMLLASSAIAAQGATDAGVRATDAPTGAAAPSTDEALGDVVNLLQQRLAIMHDVARAKWNTGAPLVDRKREEALLQSVAEKGRSAGLDPGWVRAVFSAQIEAAKIVQQADFDAWSREKRGPFTDAPDLVRELRPRIDAITAGLLRALERARPQLERAETKDRLAALAQERLRGPGIDANVRALAIAPLLPPR